LIAEYTPITIAMPIQMISAAVARMNVGRAARMIWSLTFSPEVIE
jgi:hypothetical protein